MTVACKLLSAKLHCSCKLCSNCLDVEADIPHHQAHCFMLWCAIFRFWVTERRLYQQRVAAEQNAAADLSAIAGQVASADNAIRAAKAHILSLRSQVRPTCRLILTHHKHNFKKAGHICSHVLLSHGACNCCSTREHALWSMYTSLLH